MSQGDHDLDVDVLIVGAGPVGLLGGILASRRGLSSLVVERRAGLQTAPAAHVVNARTYEICRQAGLDMDRIFAAAKDPADSGHVNFVTSLAGDLIGRLPFERQGPECLDLTPTPLRNLSQHRFEPILVDELRASDATDLRYRHQWTDSNPDPDGVTSTVRDLDGDTDLRVRSRYVIGCDGAGSRVRKMLGIEMEGPELIQCFLMIHFGADVRSLTADRPGVLHFVLDPEADGVFVVHDPDHESVFMHAIDPAAESIDDYPATRCLDVIRAAAGAPIEAEILGRSTWWMSAQTATAMGDGRILLAGDAAHRFPPTGGLGLNSGVADIHSLLWRIAAIEAGWGRPTLLESYGEERLPVARNNAQQSLVNALKMVHLSEALGTDTQPTTSQLHQAVADPGRRDAIDTAVELQAEHFDLLGLQLGYVYETGAVCPEGDPIGPGSPRVYEPSGRPGGRLPHAWLDQVGGGSTLDLVDPASPTLIAFGAHDSWRSALAAAPSCAAAFVAVGDATPSLDAWRATCGVDATGAVLVRPDQHIAWRAPDATEAGGLSAALATLSGG